MNNSNEKIEAERLRKSKQYREAILWYQKISKPDKYSYWGHAYCLNKEKRYKEAIVIARKCFLHDPSFELNNSTYAWAIYYLILKHTDGISLKKVLKAARGVKKLCPVYSKYNPYLKSLLSVLDYIDEHEVDYPADIVDWAESVDPSQLSMDHYVIKIKSKPMKMASDREKYYNEVIDMYFNQKKWPQCISMCDQALEDMDEYCYNNDIWWKRHKSHCYAHLGQYDVAIGIMKEILNKKKDWFLYSELAEMYNRVGQYELSLSSALVAAKTKAPQNMKIMLYERMIQYYEKTNNISEIEPLIHLILKIRIKNKWPIPTSLTRVINSWQVDRSSLKSIDHILNKNKKIWKRLSLKNQKSYVGKISHMLPNGYSGFVTIKGKSNGYYFSITDFEGDKKLLKKGTKVSFYLKNGFDRSKNKKVRNAFMIQIRSKSSQDKKAQKKSKPKQSFLDANKNTQPSVKSTSDTMSLLGKISKKIKKTYLNDFSRKE